MASAASPVPLVANLSSCRAPDRQPARHGHHPVAPGRHHACSRIPDGSGSRGNTVPGHAGTLARKAASDGTQLILTLGGDGTVNEAVNGLLHGLKPGMDPAFAPVPGGNANVFTRALGLPADPVDATGRILESLQAGRDRRVGLGCASPGHTSPGAPPGASLDRYFTFNAGMGLDAETVRVIEGMREHGRTLTPGLYLRTALRQFYRVTDRRHPRLTLGTGWPIPVGHLFLGIISNTSPWTFLGRRPVNPSPGASFETGLDIFALRRMRDDKHTECPPPDVCPAQRATPGPSRGQPARSARLHSPGGPAGRASGGRGVCGRARDCHVSCCSARSAGNCLTSPERSIM